MILVITKKKALLQFNVNVCVYLMKNKLNIYCHSNFNILSVFFLFYYFFFLSKRNAINLRLILHLEPNLCICFQYKFGHKNECLILKLKYHNLVLI